MKIINKKPSPVYTKEGTEIFMCPYAFLSVLRHSKD